MLSANQPLGIDQCNCSAMRKASRQITRFYDGRPEPVGLRITQFPLLAALEEACGAIRSTSCGWINGRGASCFERVRDEPFDWKLRLNWSISTVVGPHRFEI